ncbi:MAG: radical SAM protein [Thermoplasmatota archaeon]
MNEPDWVKERQRQSHVDVLIIDGYVDEPSLLGVPPYISPQPRMLVGVCVELGLSWEYITIDEYRKFGLPLGDIVITYGGVTVPGTYLSGTPINKEEAEKIAEEPGETFLGGPLARYEIVEGYDHYSLKDLSAYFFESLYGNEVDRWTNLEEREDWLRLGAKIVERHPLFPDPLIVEISAYRGCPRYFTGGCSFCSEPDYGEPEFREQRDIIQEIKILYELGVRNFRIGGQSCIISYKGKGIGKAEVPKPSPKEVKKLFRGINNECPQIKVLHVDNANPAIISNHQEESRQILETLVRFTTPGNVIAFGMESADKRVIEENNLNATPEDVKKAVKITNEVGRERGRNGMPNLLPGINFLAGLKGEREKTYDMNYEFLKNLKEEGFWLRRINIRQAMSRTGEFEVVNKRKYKLFKEMVRENIDQPILKDMLPVGSILKDVYMEKREGERTFGRQIGTYPLLVGIKYPLELGEFYNIIITDHGYRSVTGIHRPFYIDKASYRDLKAVPGIGKKRAAKIFRDRPKNKKELYELIEDEKGVKDILKYVSFKYE